MAEAHVTTIEPQIVAYIKVKGAFDQIPEAMERLYRWVVDHSLTPEGMPQAVFHTEPEEVSDSQAVWELRAPLAGDLQEMEPDAEGIGVRRIEAETIASATHKGPYDSVAPVYEDLKRWIAENGMRVSGPPTEVYYSDAEEVPSDEYLTEIRMPVEPAR